MMNLSQVLETQASQHAERVAVVAGGREWTYSQLNARANRVAGVLAAAGLQPGDRVALSMPTCADFIVCYFAVLKMGGVVVALGTLLRPHEQAAQMNTSGAAALICHGGLAATGWEAFQQADACRYFWVMDAGGSAAGDLPADARLMDEACAGQPEVFETCLRRPDDGCCIVFTSGTTGAAKGAELSHSNLMMHWLVVREILQYTREDRVLVAAPMYHVLAQSLLMGPAFSVGARLVLLPKFDPASALAAFYEHRITFFTGVPSMYLAMLNAAPPDAEALGVIRSHWTRGLVGGAPVPPDLLQRVTDRFGPKMLIGYGLSETTVLSCIHRLDVACPAESVGLPILGVDVRIVDADMKEVPLGERGEIVVRGHNIMKGYYNRPDANAEAFAGGWFHTGDVGTRDESGFIYVVDRVKDIIIRGGRKICPSEVEHVIQQHPEVLFAAVVGMPHEELGEEVVAYAVLSQGAAVCEEELIAWVKERVAVYSYPRSIRFCDTLPLGPTGKILRKQLRDELMSGRAVVASL